MYFNTFLEKNGPGVGGGGGGGGGREDSHMMKGTVMLVVSLRGENFGFWSRLRCSGQNVIIFSRQGLFKGCTRRNIYIKKEF